MAGEKRKITDIFEEKVVARKERNQDGEWEVVEKVVLLNRPVKTLSPVSRLAHFYIDGFAISFLLIPIEIYAHFNPSIVLDLIPLPIYFCYYVLLEFYFQKTLGKFMTSSVVVNEYGERPDIKSIFYRTLARVVPFEPFSFFWSSDERWWHDSWPKTFVVSKAELSLVNRIIAGERPTRADEGQWDEWHKWK